MIRLERFTNEHYGDLIAWVVNTEILMQFAGDGFVFPLTAEQLDVYLQDRNRLAFRVVNEETNLPIGHCELYLTEDSFKLARIFIGDEKNRGKGFGQEIIRKLLDFGFSNFDRTKAELNVFDWNVPAVECYKKVGFISNFHQPFNREMNGRTWVVINMVFDKSKWVVPSKRAYNKPSWG